ncbi:MAG: iron-containing alcohol dehydrogenase [Eubacteriales bacterium]|nr:iron-containing alcohol dehydrogenase [Eubacteriales bacterium]
MGFQYYVPTRILFGKGQLERLSRKKLPGKKALIVISSGKSTRANGYLDRVEQQLEKAGVESVVFDKIAPNPMKSVILEGAQLAKAEGCEFVVGLGGGSSIDSAKAIAVMATNDGDLWDYVYGGTGGAGRMKNKPLPIIAITTTAGTGTEADAWAVVTNEATEEKIGFGNDNTFPMLSIVDPDLMLSVPPKFTAYQGFDALFHSTEGYLSTRASLMSDMYALKAVEMVGRNLARAVHDGSDEEAREKIAFGNTLGGFVMSVGTTTSEHSIEHAMSAYHSNLPHGAGLIMISLAYYRFFAQKEECRERLIDLAKAMGNETANDPMDFVDALEQLQKDCGVADLKMSDYGITPDEFEQIAKNARSTMGAQFKCDRVPLTEEDCIEILRQSYK